MERRLLESVGRLHPGPGWHSLYAIPFGLFTMQIGLGKLGLSPLGPWNFLAGLAAFVALSYGVGRYYKRSLGTVTPTARTATRMTIAVGVWLTVFVAGLHAGRALGEGPPEGAANAQAVAWGVAMLAFHAIGTGLRAHHVVVWGVVIVAGLLPVWARPPAGDAASLLLMGGAVALTGALDHRLLVRTLARARDRVGVGSDTEGGRASA